MEEEEEHFRRVNSVDKGRETERSLASSRHEESSEELRTREPAEPQSGERVAEGTHVGCEQNRSKDTSYGVTAPVQAMAVW